ncbi:hypothetical protein HanHA89_Chr14g0576831 [Helianthus annuus]|nr:hypothetical protein HanHA89_Chr14g0576831 [Helianthus annuus]
MFKSPRRNGRNKGFKIKHVIQVSMLLGVSIWLLYQIHHSDDKKPSVTTKISHELDNDTIENVVVKLGRKDLRPKVKGTKPDDEQKIETVEGRESQGHEEVGENERVDSKEDVEEVKNQVVGMEDTEKQMSPNLKDGKVSIPSEDVADGEDENDKMMNNGENDTRSSSKQPSVDDNEHDSKIQTEEQIDSAPDTYPNGTDRAIYLLTTGNEKSMEGDGESEAQSKTLESIQGEAEQKGDLSIQEEEKDALTDLETLPGNNGTGGGSIALENAATD